MSRFTQPSSISKGLGNLTPDYWSAITEATAEVGRQSPPLRQPVSPARCFLAKITASQKGNAGLDPTDANYAPNRFIWQYSFAEVKPQWGTLVATVPKIAAGTPQNPRTGSLAAAATNTGAYNLVEILNTESHVGPGVDLPTDDSISISEVETGTVVFMYEFDDPSGSDSYTKSFHLFSQDNPFGCQAGAGAAAATLDLGLDFGTFLSASMSGSSFDFGGF